MLRKSTVPEPIEEIMKQDERFHDLKAYRQSNKDLHIIINISSSEEVPKTIKGLVLVHQNNKDSSVKGEGEGEGNNREEKETVEKKIKKKQTAEEAIVETT